MKYEVDFSQSVASAKKAQVTNKPFKSNGPKAYAVYAENENGEIVRVDFDAAKASDENNLGPKWKSKTWAHKAAVAADNFSPNVNSGNSKVTLNQLADYYTERVTNPKADLDWDGTTFHNHLDLLKAMPTLVNSKVSYEDENVLNTGREYPYDAKANPERSKR